MDEKGYIKFQCNWIKTEPVENKLIEEIVLCRNKLYKLGLIGAYSNGIGFGNLSIRLANNIFIITGTSTGQIANLNNNHFTKVTGYNFMKNSLTCEGPVKASSESLTHAAVYESDNFANAVIHIHNKSLWEKLLNVLPATSPEIEYGTPAMAEEVKRLFKETDLIEKKIFVMAGHEEGIVSFGRNLEEAFKTILFYN
jgi:ribulose-5-phosphate 4-epimerase/fuculose-1-phosphate aldolase